LSATDPAAILVIIPALNEERAIRDVVSSVLAECPNVLVIDDGSTDATVARLEGLAVDVIRHAQPLGKGECLREGFREALRRGFDAVVTMDGDGQHVAADIPRLLVAARAHPEHIVIGARLLGRENQPAARARANAVADWGISWACGVPVADTQSGQRYYPREALQLVDLDAEGFVFEAAILIAAARERGIRIISIPIESRYHAEFRGSHFRPVRDVTRITCYTIGRILHYGAVVASYRLARAHAPPVMDP
jgi:glycosyltransferase involved in cell wall biosynthesis